MRHASWPERFLMVASILFSVWVVLAVAVGWEWLDVLAWPLVVFSGLAASVWLSGSGAREPSEPPSPGRDCLSRAPSSRAWHSLRYGRARPLTVSPMHSEPLQRHSRTPTKSA